MLLIKRFCQKRDKKFIYFLRNKIHVRSYFFNNKILSYIDHVRWLRDQIKKCEIFCIYFKNKQIGYIRYDKKEHFYIISVAIERDYRKRGLTRAAIILSEKFLNKKNTVFADVLRHNRASLRFFKSCGYHIFRVNNKIFKLKKLIKQT